jgi:class 3 adenylate cyclase
MLSVESTPSYEGQTAHALANRGLLSRFPRRSWIWGTIIGLSFIAVTAMLYTAPDVALQYWFLFNTPMFIASFVFGLRGALAGSIITILSITFLFYGSESLYRQVTAGLQPILELGSTTISSDLILDISSSAVSGTRPAAVGRVSEAVGQVSSLVFATDPRAAAARAIGGLLSLILTNIFLGLLTDRARFQEATALRRASEQLKRYFSPQLVQAIVSGERSMGLATVRKEISVVFADLRGFTSLTERLEPEELGRMLNEYLTEMTDVIFTHDGTLDKYIGDAVMAFFGDPIAHGDDVERAIRTAVEMRERFRRLRSTWAKEGREQIYVGIGVNTGYATVGNVGSPVRMEYTVIGSTVNVGARLADTAKPDQILITQRTLAAVRHMVEWREVGKMRLQGVPYDVEVVEVLGLRRVSQSAEPHLSESPVDAVVAHAADDPEFRVSVVRQPEVTLRPYRLNEGEQTMVCDLAGLLGYPVFRSVAGPDVVRFIRLAVVERYAAGTVIFREGEAADRFYLITRGEVALYKTDHRGRERHLATLSRGGHFGEPGTIEAGPRSVTAYATGDVELLALTTDHFLSLEDQAPGLMQNITMEASRREFVLQAAAQLPV